MESERLTLTISEFAKLAGISRNQAYSLAAGDKLPVPVIRFGKRMVVSKASALSLLQGEPREP